MERQGSGGWRDAEKSTQLGLLAAAKCKVVSPVPQFPYLRNEADYLGGGVQEADGAPHSYTC